MEKNGSVFIKDVKVKEDIIKIYYSDNTKVDLPYTYEAHQMMLNKRKASLENFDIDGLCKDISQKNVRRLAILIIGLITGVIFHPIIISLVLSAALLIGNELYQKDLEYTKHDYLKSRADLDLTENIKVVTLKDMKKQKEKSNNKSEINELQELKVLVSEESKRADTPKTKVYQNNKK